MRKVVFNLFFLGCFVLAHAEESHYIDSPPVNNYKCSGMFGEELIPDGGFGTGTVVFPNDTLKYLKNKQGFGLHQVYGMPTNDNNVVKTNTTSGWDFPFHNNFWHHNVEDNSPDPNGYMLVINAQRASTKFYETTILDVCELSTYRISVDIFPLGLQRFLGQTVINPNVGIYANGKKLHTFEKIPLTGSWQTLFYDYSPEVSSDSIIIEYKLEAFFAGYHDVAVDNVSLRKCIPDLDIVANGTDFCSGEDIMLIATTNGLEKAGGMFHWQQLSAGTWNDIVGQNSDTLKLENAEVSHSGMYRYMFSPDSSATNCFNLSDTASIHIFEDHRSAGEVELNECFGEVFVFEGIQFNQAGDTTYTFVDDNGCDSIVTLKLNWLPTHQDSFEVEICEGEDYSWNGIDYSTTGVFSQTLQNSFGCDSIVSLSLTVNSIFDSTNTVVICEGESYNGITLTEDSSWVESLKNSFNCDSTIRHEVTVLNNVVTDKSFTVCFNDDFNGTSISRDTVIVENYLAQNGCDSIVRNTISVNEIHDLAIAAKICEGESYLGFTPVLDTVIIENLLTSTGCDSTVTHNVVVNAKYELEEEIKGCGSVRFNGQEILKDTVIVEGLKTISGCDSSVTTTIKVMPDYSLVNNSTICLGETYLGFAPLSDTVITQNLSTHLGCDSIIQHNVRVNNSYRLNLNNQICEGESYLGFTPSFDTVIIENLLSSTSCDSTVTHNVVVNTKYEIKEEIEACGSVDFQGQSIIRDTTIIELLQSSTGCDSTITTVFVVHSEYFVKNEEEICLGEGHKGHFPTSDTVIVEKLTSFRGCDSIIQTKINVIQKETETIDIFVCEADYQYQNINISRDTTIIEEIPFGNCSKVITTNFSVDIPNAIALSHRACEGDSIFVNNQWFLATDASTFTENLKSEEGCDSVVVHTFDWVPSYRLETTQTITDTTINGVFIDRDTTIIENLLSVGGCDSILITNYKTVNHTENTNIISACDSALFKGKYYYSNQTFYEETTNSLGEIHKQTTIIEVHTSYEKLNNQQICEGDFYEFEGKKYSTEGKHIVSYQTKNGCDSNLVLNLSWMPVQKSIVETEICEGDIYEGLLIANDTILIFEEKNVVPCGKVTEHRVKVLKNNNTSYIDKSSAILCEGVDVDLTVQGITEPIWSTGEAQNIITVSESGEYTVKGKDVNECPVTVTSIVPPKLKFVPLVEGKDPSCFGEGDGLVTFKNFHQLNGEVFFSNNGGETFQKDPEFDGLFSGEYDLVIKDALGCEFESTVLLTKPEALEIDILNSEETGRLLVGDNFVLDLEVSRNQREIDSVRWFGEVPCDTCLQNIVQPTEDVTYTVVVYDTLGCKAEDELSLEVIPDLNVILPNAFSPNSDGENDIFKPIFSGDGEGLVEAFVIFDRWGEAIFKQTNMHSSSSRIGWDGTYKGYELRPAPFIYLLQVRTLDGRHKVYKGDVLLVR